MCPDEHQVYAQQRVLSGAEYDETVTQELLVTGRCSAVVYKEQFLTAQELRGVHAGAVTNSFCCI